MNNPNPAAAAVIANARRMGHSTQTAAFAISLITGEAWESLCAWCLEKRDPESKRESHRAGHGVGECSGCAYTGRDTLVVGPEVKP